MFPTAVWRYLVQPPPSGRPPIREQLIARWEQFGRLGKTESERARLTGLLFGDGGRYTIDDLRTRADMLGDLRAEITLMNQDLGLFLQEVLALEVPPVRG